MSNKNQIKNSTNFGQILGKNVGIGGFESSTHHIAVVFPLVEDLKDELVP